MVNYGYGCSDYVGECDVCDYRYTFAEYEPGYERINEGIHVYKNCPKCFYDPELSIKIPQFVSGGLGARISTKGRVEFCYDEISLSIQEYFKEHFEELDDFGEERYLHIFEDIPKRVSLVMRNNIQGTFSSGRLFFNDSRLVELVRREVIEIWRDNR